MVLGRTAFTEQQALWFWDGLHSQNNRHSGFGTDCIHRTTDTMVLGRTAFTEHWIHGCSFDAQSGSLGYEVAQLVAALQAGRSRFDCRSQWPRGLRRRRVAVRFLGLRVRIQWLSGLRGRSASNRLLGLRVWILPRVCCVLCGKYEGQASTIKTKKQVRKKYIDRRREGLQKQKEQSRWGLWNFSLTWSFRPH